MNSTFIFANMLYYELLVRTYVHRIDLLKIMG